MRKVVGVALFIYAVMLGAGGTAYYVLSQRQPPAPVETQPVEKGPTPEELAEAQRREAERAAKRAREEELAQQVDALKQQLGSKIVNGVTYYGFPSREMPAPGVYLRPYTCYDGNGLNVKMDIYYHYTIDDGTNIAWIHGDHLAVNCDGQSYDFALNKQNRHDITASDATGLSEHYVMTATEPMLSMLKQAAQAESVSIQYYQAANGKVRSHTLTADERVHIAQVMQLYKLMGEQLTL